MQTLRQLFLVEKLRDAATSGDPRQLQLVRDIIRQIKLVQLEHITIATDAMIIGLLQQMHEEKQKELQLISHYLEEAHQRISAPKS